MITYNEVLSNIQNKLADSDNIKALRHQDVNLSILNFTDIQWLTGDIKEIDCTNAYINLNFETAGTNIGKGKVGGEREGWAICNGNNGTKNRTGRVSVGYGSSPFGWVSAIFSSIGPNNYTPVYGGSKDAVVVEHTHNYQTRGGTLYNGEDSNKFRDNSTNPGPFNTYTTDPTGVSGTDKNLQPYIVTLFIQKL